MVSLIPHHRIRKTTNDHSEPRKDTGAEESEQRKRIDPK
jgi:hypothetical protein